MCWTGIGSRASAIIAEGYWPTLPVVMHVGFSDAVPSPWATAFVPGPERFCFMKSYTYNDGLLPAGRTPHLWIVAGDIIHTFAGGNIPGTVAVGATHYEKNGKWSNTTYELVLADNATPCNMVAPMHGRVWPDNDRWTAYERFSKEYGIAVSFEAFDVALLRDYPRAHVRMVEGEKALESLTPTGDSEMVSISTRQSCRRNPHSDVRVKSPDGREWVVAHEAPVSTSVEGIFRVVDVKHTPGYRGGVTTLTFAVASGVSVEGYGYAKDGSAHEWAMGRNGDGQPPSPKDNRTVGMLGLPL